jgi:hypothetical protein
MTHSLTHSLTDSLSSDACWCPQFVAKAGEKATSAKERSLDRTCGDLLQKICRKYDNLSEVDKLSSVSQKVESVKLVMQDNIDIALQNCVKLESIGKAAEELQQQAGVFKRNAHELKKRMWWKNLKVSRVPPACLYAASIVRLTARAARYPPIIIYVIRLR